MTHFSVKINSGGSPIISLILMKRSFFGLPYPQGSLLCLLAKKSFSDVTSQAKYGDAQKERRIVKLLQLWAEKAKDLSAWHTVLITLKKSKIWILTFDLDFWSKQSVKFRLGLLGMSQWHLDSQVVKWPKLQLHPAAILQERREQEILSFVSAAAEEETFL